MDLVGRHGADDDADDADADDNADDDGGGADDDADARPIPTLTRSLCTFIKISPKPGHAPQLAEATASLLCQQMSAIGDLGKPLSKRSAVQMEIRRGGGGG